MRDRYDFSNAVVGKYAGKVRGDAVVSRTTRSVNWSNPSVLNMAGDRDPVEAVREKARRIVLEAIDTHTLCLPVDPFRLAELQSIKVVPSSSVLEARTIAGPDKRPLIEYNPARSRARIRFSICHELAHTLFPDCLNEIRYRGAAYSSVDHELEILCNIAAAEFLLPLGSIQADLENLKLSIDTALNLRLKYEASVEAVLLRMLGLSATDFAVYSATPSSELDENGRRRYRLDYIRSTPGWITGLKRGDLLPADTVAEQCTVIGTTAKSEEEWKAGLGKRRVEMVGAAPYHGEHTLPRVVGLMQPQGRTHLAGSPFEVLRGDALKPRGGGTKIVAHVVSDAALNWGAGFGRAVQTKWPGAQQHFKEVFQSHRGSKLGLTTFSKVEDGVYTFQMVCQHGYGPSPTTRLRYEALRECLGSLREVAQKKSATVHMPRIGAGEAGGSWGLISNLITEELSSEGVAVTVYEQLNKQKRKTQPTLFEEA